MTQPTLKNLNKAPEPPAGFRPPLNLDEVVHPGCLITFSAGGRWLPPGNCIGRCSFDIVDNAGHVAFPFLPDAPLEPPVPFAFTRVRRGGLIKQGALRLCHGALKWTLCPRRNFGQPALFSCFANPDLSAVAPIPAGYRRVRARESVARAECLFFSDAGRWGTKQLPGDFVFQIPAESPHRYCVASPSRACLPSWVNPGQVSQAALQPEKGFRLLTVGEADGEDRTGLEWWFCGGWRAPRDGQVFKAHKWMTYRTKAPLPLARPPEKAPHGTNSQRGPSVPALLRALRRMWAARSRASADAEILRNLR